ncbi:NAD(P)-binding domain-containing protein [Variovorax sp. J31P207]|uniref:flavin-containing monooxygenase n=1 Tax=Variovorax sp. J31P207 TaxID=3053510 RepID=UPI0025785DF4|nr:NAD(P)-binding domain-containing protein [Variovorax sp. J31P207]MDM0072357.1 NAD(P)-binding domain-containing protein [Variovorax sp. J31P207]
MTQTVPSSSHAFRQLDTGALRASGGPDTNGDSRASAAASANPEQRFDVVVIGGGQAGLSVGHYLARKGLRFVILEGSARVGDGWRHRWDSLRLFSPARFDGLTGMRFPAPPRYFPTKDEMADFLEAYAAKFELPVRTGVKVEELTRANGHYVVRAGERLYLADHVVVAAASYQKPKIPHFAADLDSSIHQIHALGYRRPSQLKAGVALVVGAGNSGAEIASELSRTHQVWLAGRHPGHIPIEHGSVLAYYVVLPILFRLVFHRLLSVDTPIGRKALPSFISHGTPLIRLRPKNLDRAGILRVPSVTGVQRGLPMLEDGRLLNVDNIVWCTGFQPGLDWIKLPVFDASGRIDQYRGVVAHEPGLYVAGLAFQYSASSGMIHGTARDAERLANTIEERIRVRP